MRQHLLLDLRQTCSRAASWISICLLLKLCCSRSHRRPPAPEAHLKPQTGSRGSSSHRRPPMLPQAYKCSRPSYCHRLNQAKLLPQAHPGQAAATGSMTAPPGKKPALATGSQTPQAEQLHTPQGLWRTHKFHHSGHGAHLAWPAQLHQPLWNGWRCCRESIILGAVQRSENWHSIHAEVLEAVRGGMG